MTTDKDALRKALEEAKAEFEAIAFMRPPGNCTSQLVQNMELTALSGQRNVEKALAATAQPEQPVATLLIGGVDSRGELSENDIELHMRAIEALQVTLVAHGAVDGAKIQLFTSPQVRTEQTAVPTVEEVENVVGMGHNCWDCIKPEEIIEAVLMLAAAPQPPQENKT
jgi:hypothetical protein